MLEIEKIEEKVIPTHLLNPLFEARMRMQKKVNAVENALSDLLSEFENSHYEIEQYYEYHGRGHYGKVPDEDLKLFETHQRMLKDQKTSREEVARAIRGRETAYGHREGLLSKVRELYYGACPDCGGFTDGDGESEGDGCAQDWVVVERSWAWCIGFGPESELTGDCCGLAHRELVKARDSLRRHEMNEYLKWLSFGGESTSLPHGYTVGDWGSAKEKREAEEAEKGLVRTGGPYRRDYEPRTEYVYTPEDGHDEDCVNRDGCGWSTKSSRITASGGSY
jgi:hypothetical protein